MQKQKAQETLLNHSEVSTADLRHVSEYGRTEAVALKALEILRSDYHQFVLSLVK